MSAPMPLGRLAHEWAARRSTGGISKTRWLPAPSRGLGAAGGGRRMTSAPCAYARRMGGVEARCPVTGGHGEAPAGHGVGSPRSQSVGAGGARWRLPPAVALSAVRAHAPQDHGACVRGAGGLETAGPVTGGHRVAPACRLTGAPRAQPCGTGGAARRGAPVAAARAQPLRPQGARGAVPGRPERRWRPPRH